MLRPEISWHLCQTCQPCEARAACSTRAIVKIDSDSPPYIALERCTGCSKCISACPFAAIHMRTTNPGSPGFGTAR